MNKRVLLTSAFAVVSLVACKDAKTTADKEDQVAHGINLEYMDKNVKPGDDFFRYVNGAWYDKTEIPDDRTRWGSFDELRKNTDKDAIDILKEAVADTKLDPKSDQAKAVAIYQTYLDDAKRNELGVSPLKPYLDKINAIKTPEDATKLINELVAEGGLGLYSIYVYADAKNSQANAVYLSTGSLGLPDRDYYVLNDKDIKEKRDQYVAHVARMLELAGESKEEATTDSKRVLSIETKMATPRLTRVERRDSRLTYNPMTIAELQKITPAVDWNAYIAATGLKNVDKVIVSQPKYMKALNEILSAKNIDELKAYMKWTLVNGNASYLSTDMEKANWEFYSKTLEGAKEQRPVDERALAVVNGTVGEALGQLYVAKKFPAEAKAKAQAMIKNVLTAFGERIKALPWMAEETKKGALEKLATTTVKIGYPDKWEDYSAMAIKSPKDGGNHFENMKNAEKWDIAKNMSDFGKPVDKSRWGMAPQTVNAYFNPIYNEIVFPAAILQPPFYDYKADEAINYGGIGAVIGHEISHSFDDSGARYDKNGNLNNWWTDADLERFTKLGDALAGQYSALEPLPGVFVDGKFTLGENIGDLGGVNAAYDGLKIFLKENGDPGLIDGFTPQQRFFISWGTIWRTKARDEAIKNQVKTDPHAPGHYRAYVPLQNVDAFYEAFGIKEGDKLYIKPENRVKIW
ncbi:M13 family metallopeptidase [Myroides marinus]|uniref:M13 family metallopeptidase n=1 Tax=Myroides marinus TaxID=703342 RepID=UPI0025775A3B|nr:M13 family metallopeptidase [Myroides marinus]MDM1378551.1 M13 family metallopeptidase [Myroides marinus]MDM1385822.1 M13 family metallopeptidase [Myroides marinus]MDM1393035.1 M13 family metallopeptidase [Myroides marinus]